MQKQKQKQKRFLLLLLLLQLVFQRVTREELNLNRVLRIKVVGMIDSFWKEFERSLFIHTHKTTGKGRKSEKKKKKKGEKKTELNE